MVTDEIKITKAMLIDLDDCLGGSGSCEGGWEKELSNWATLWSECLPPPDQLQAVEGQKLNKL